MSSNLALIATCVACLLSGATAQLHVVAPSAHNTADAVGQNRIAGAGGDLRQQILVGEAHLLPMIGTTIQAIEFRRSASTEVFLGGSIQGTISLSTSATPPIECSPTFAANVGSGEQQVFSGPITIPTSPGVTGATVPWSANNIVRIQLSSPYAYSGGTLCIDVIGAPIAGQEPGWWMTDAADEGQSGTITDLGGGCGTFGNVSFRSSIAQRSLVAGTTARMIARGTPYGLGIVAIGPKYIPGTPLAALGFPNAPSGCSLHLSQIDLLDARIFTPDPDPLLAMMGARADFTLKIPAVPSALGFQMTTQWFDWTQTATSNAIEWMISTSMPALNMALVEGHPLETTGRATVNHAHVLRFEYQ